MNSCLAVLSGLGFMNSEIRIHKRRREQASLTQDNALTGNNYQVVLVVVLRFLAQTLYVNHITTPSNFAWSVSFKLKGISKCF